MKRLLATALGLVLSSACGSSPIQPSLDIGGTWVGVMSYVQQVNGSPASRAENVTMNLTQAGSSVTGSWLTSIRSGTLDGTATQASFSGTFTYNATSPTGAACIGTLNVSGGAGGPVMTWTSPSVVENCSGQPENITFALHR